MRLAWITVALASTALHAQVFQGVTMTGVSVSTVLPAPLSGITFSPVAGTYPSAQTVSISSFPSAGLNLLYATDGDLVTEASPVYSSSFTVAANTTVNAMTISPPKVLAQNIQQCATGTCWKTQLACTATQCSPYKTHFNSPGIAYGTGAGCNTGVCGIPTAVGFNTGIASPGRTGNSTHLWFTTQNVSGAGSQTQVLWANRTAGCDSCTYQVEDFYMYPAENATKQWARESDLVNWVRTRNVNLSAALQCDIGNGTNPHWQYNGQSGSWNDFGDTTSVFKNGVLVTASPKITEGCNGAITGGIHVQYHASFVPNAKHCTDVKTGLATECVYIDYLAINGDVYSFGTKTVTDGNGNPITVSALTAPGAVLQSGYPSRCFNQLQIDTAGTGASASNPITYGLYYDQVDMSCGGGTPNANGAAIYTIPGNSFPVTIPGSATAYTGLEQLSGWTADASSSISPNPPTTYTINQTGTPVVMTLDTVGTSGIYTGWMAKKGVSVATGLNMVLRATYTFDSVAGIQAWEVGRRRTNAAQVTDNGQTQLVPKSGGVLEFDIVPSSSGGWTDTGCRFPTFVAGTKYTEELYYVNDTDGSLSLEYVEMNGTVCPIPSGLQHIAGAVQSPPWSANVSTMAFQPDANPSATPFNATVTLSAWVW